MDFFSHTGIRAQRIKAVTLADQPGWFGRRYLRPGAPPRTASPALTSGPVGPAAETSASRQTVIRAMPPLMTDHTGPSAAATMPDSNSPSWFDAPMNRLTALTRPHLVRVSGCTNRPRITTLIMSAAPSTVNAADSGSQRETPKAIVARPNAAFFRTSIITRPASDGYFSTRRQPQRADRHRRTAAQNTQLPEPSMRISRAARSA